MLNRPSWEVLVGETSTLDYLASLQDKEQQPQHPLQLIIEEIIQGELTEHEREIFQLRFGEMLSYREIADTMGYDSHQTFHYQVEKIMDIVGRALKERLERHLASQDNEPTGAQE